MLRHSSPYHNQCAPHSLRSERRPGTTTFHPHRKCGRRLLCCLAHSAFLVTSPLPATTTGLEVRPLPLPTASMALTTSMPLTTLPKTTCLPSRCGVRDVVRKNWLPLVLGPALAIESRKGSLCPTTPFSNS